MKEINGLSAPDVGRSEAIEGIALALCGARLGCRGIRCEYCLYDGSNKEKLKEVLCIEVV